MTTEAMTICVWCKDKPAKHGRWCSLGCAEATRDDAHHGFAKARKRIDEFQSYIDDLEQLAEGYADWARAAGEIFSALSKDFYKSKEWREARYAALERYERKCMACGRTPEDDVKMHVDHIKPRSKHPDLALEVSNLQILCEDCNLGKGNKYSTDWRPKTAPARSGGLDLPDF